MSPPGQGPQEEWAEGAPERLYVVTSGRSRPADEVDLDLVTLIVSRGGTRPGMQPEHAAIARMCTSPLSVAEISAHLSLPVSTVTVLLGDLMDGDCVEAREPATVAAHPDVQLLEAVMDGLRRI